MTTKDKSLALSPQYLFLLRLVSHLKVVYNLSRMTISAHLNHSIGSAVSSFFDRKAWIGPRRCSMSMCSMTPRSLKIKYAIIAIHTSNTAIIATNINSTTTSPYHRTSDLIFYPTPLATPFEV